MTSGTETIIGATPKLIWVVEDNDSVRLPLIKGLKQRGFDVNGTATRDETLELMKKDKREIDVAVLDVHLEDSPATTGYDIGKEMVMAQPDLPPKMIIYTGQDDDNQEFYKNAVEPRYDNYIPKATTPSILNQVRTFSLVRALSPVRSEISEKLGQIAESVLDTFKAAERICLQVIAPEVEVCLGLPSIFLLSDSRSGEILASEGGFSEECARACAKIQNKIFEADGNNVPFILTLNKMDMLLDDISHDFLKKYEGGNFIPLYNEEGLRLSIGILPAKKTDPLWEEKDPRKLADNLNRKLFEPVVKQFKYLARIKATIEKTKLKHTSNFCLYVSKTQINALEESLNNQEIDRHNKCFRKLKRLADDLQATGIEFSQINDLYGRAKTEAASIQNVSARSIVEQARQILEDQGTAKELELEQTGEDFELRIASKDLLIAVLRMLQWLAQRVDDEPREEANRRVIEVAYERHEGRVAIRFTDHSKRLGERLRRRLFEPFTQSATTSADIRDKGENLPGLYLPLYLAKTIITVKNNGLLEDRTDELPGDHGHCFLMSFPIEEEENPDAENG